MLAKLSRDNGIAAPKGPPGSIVVFDSNLMHGSGANISPFPRCNLFVVYNSTENTPHAPYSGLEPRPSYIANREIIPLAI
jgi:ectoine hydroxylase